MGRKNRGTTKGRVSRIGSYAIAEPNSISCTTFNILAPIYKRLNLEVVFFLFLLPFLPVFVWFKDLLMANFLLFGVCFRTRVAEKAIIGQIG